MVRRHARAVFCAALGLAVAGRLAAQDSTQFTDAAAADLFRYSRMAISNGRGNIAAIHALILKGRSKFQVEGGLTAAAVEIRMIIPDYYLRIDTSGTLEKRAGYAGKTVISAIRDAGSITYPPDRLVSTILLNERQRVARFLLGALTYVSGDLAMTFSSVPRSVELIDPRVNTRRSLAVDNSTAEPYTALVSGPRFSARFIVDGTNRTPSQVVYVGGDKKPVTIRFEDRRTVEGFLLPFRITTMSENRTVDELVFDEILVNPELSKNDFKRP